MCLTPTCKYASAVIEIGRVKRIHTGGSQRRTPIGFKRLPPCFRIDKPHHREEVVTFGFIQVEAQHSENLLNPQAYPRRLGSLRGRITVSNGAKNSARLRRMAASTAVNTSSVKPLSPRSSRPM